MKTRKCYKIGGKNDEMKESDVVIDLLATVRYNIKKYGGLLDIQNLDFKGNSCPDKLVKLFIDIMGLDEEEKQIDKEKNANEFTKDIVSQIKKDKKGGYKNKRNKTQKPRKKK
tara:strand:+ start:61 stop:399 length:339 start_codon:yes stop_codon:yes gene_type:complete